MSNNYFHFKQFTIQQQDCAMKVSTDACLFGALTDVTNCKRALDIGTGTGLLALQLAQRNTQLKIDAIEIDELCSQQAKRNFSSSVFSKQLNLINIDAREFKGNHKYDLIVCNPPFFNNHLKSTDIARRKARHTDTLTFFELAQCVAHNISEDGSFWYILPTEFCEALDSELFAVNLHVHYKCLIAHDNSKPFTRGVIKLGFSEVSAIIEDYIYIYDYPQSDYTTRFKALLAPYYLNL